MLKYYCCFDFFSKHLYYVWIFWQLFTLTVICSEKVKINNSIFTNSNINFHKKNESNWLFLKIKKLSTYLEFI